MQQGLLPHRLNCPWRAAAAAAVVCSSMSAPTAAIGRVPLVISSHGAWASIAAQQRCIATNGRTDSLCVALRIDLSREICVMQRSKYFIGTL